MQTKFIEGTNEQYSIREDGVVIRHYMSHRDFNTGKMVMSYKKVKVYGSLNIKSGRRVNIKINNKLTQVNVPRLVLESFTNTKFYGKCFKILYKDNDMRNCSLDNLEMTLPKGKTLSTKKEQENSEREKSALRYQTIYKFDLNYMNNARKKQKNNVNKISKSYIASLCKLKKTELSNDLYKLYKSNILVKRKLSEKIGIHINSFK